MSLLLALARLIDAINEKIGLAVSWALLLAVLICAGNAIVRYTFNMSSNAWLEIQWYLFAAMFLLAGAYTLKRNEHVRIDVIVGRFSRRTQIIIDIFGFAIFLLPVSLLILYFSIPFAMESLRNQEVSSNAGGLILWPAKMLIPIGFILLILQGFSELIKRLACLAGLVDAKRIRKAGRHAGGRNRRDRGRQQTRRAAGESMSAFLIANMAPIMFGALVVFLLSGFPVAFALAANGLFFGLLGIELGLLRPELLQALPNRLFGIMANDTLLAIPFFTFMGLILERSGMAEDLLDTIGQLFGPIRGGVAYAVIFVGALLAATTGVVAASVISMGLISLPVMLRYGYDKRLASGVIAASGTLAQIIPPSLVLIVMADQLGRSVGDMYKAAFFPGLMLTAMYAGYVLAVSIFRPSAAPALPLEARNLREPNGDSGVRSLAVLVVGRGRHHATLFEPVVRRPPSGKAVRRSDASTARRWQPPSASCLRSSAASWA